MLGSIGRALFGALLMLSACVAQVDINVNARGPYADLGRGLVWAGSGLGAINNNYIYSPVTPDLGVCVFVANKDVGAHTFTLDTYHSGDPRSGAFSVSTWVHDGAQAAGSVTGTGGAQVVWSYYYPPMGAARVALVLAGGSGTGVADVYVVQTNATGCAGSYTSTVASSLACSTIGSLVTLPGNSTVIVGQAGKSVHICYLSVSLQVAADVTIIAGTGATCTTGLVGLSGTYYAVTALSLDLPNLSMVAPVGLSVCLNGAGTSGGLVGYAIY